MSWYDTFPNTKINYFLIPLLLALGPLIYFYTRKITEADFKFKSSMIWHFVPQIIFIIGRLGIYIYDSTQSGFDDVQNGKLFSSMPVLYIGSIIDFLQNLSMVIYLLLSIQLYLKYQKHIQKIYSSENDSTLLWLRNFLGIFTAVFIIMQLLMQIDDITNLHYTDYWWGHLIAAITLLYLGWYGYFTDINNIQEANVSAGVLDIEISHPKGSNDQEALDKLTDIINEKALFLNSGLTLAELSKEIGKPAKDLSKLINSASGQNFNDYINGFRINAVKKAIEEGKADSYTLLSIAYNSGFNSKATFNRTFKKLTGLSPSQYLNTTK